MSFRTLALCLLSSLPLMSCGGGGGSPSTGPADSTQTAVDSKVQTKAVLANANVAIEKLKTTINSGGWPRNAKALLKDLEASQVALADIEAQRIEAQKQLEGVRMVFNQLGNMTADLERDKALLQKDKAVLTEEKRKLEQREATLTTQLCAAVVAALAAVVAFLSKWPNDVLDREYRRLEIKLKALELEKAAGPKDVAPHPVTLLKRLKSIKLQGLGA